MLKQAREDVGVGQRELCRMLGRSYTYVQKIESGEREVRVVEAVEFVSALKLDVREFFGKFLTEIGQ